MWVIIIFPNMSRGKTILELVLLIEWKEGNVRFPLFIQPELIRKDDTDILEQNDVQDIEADIEIESEKSDHFTDTEQFCDHESDKEQGV